MTAPLTRAPVPCIDWEEVERQGYVVEEKARGGKLRWRLYFRTPHGRVRLAGAPSPIDGTMVPFGSREDAERWLRRIQAEIATTGKLETVLARYLQRPDPEMLVERRVQEWLGHLEQLEAAGRRSPNTLREYRRWSAAGGPFSWWYGRTIQDIDARSWRLWVEWYGATENAQGRRPSAKTVKNVSDGFRAFLGFLARDGALERLPAAPVVDVPEYVPSILSVDQQSRVIAAWPWESRGAVLVAAREALRVSEIRALDLDDYEPESGRMRVARSIQGPRQDARRVEHTKNRGGEWRSLWDDELRRWLDWRLGQATPERRLRGEVALCWNPRARDPEKRWTPDPLEKAWHRACEKAGVSRISFQQGTRHTTLTALGAHLPERLLRSFSRHRDARSLDHYAKPSAHPEQIRGALKRGE